MTKTAVTKLKASLAHYIKQVKAGEEILVTERGEPVAKIVPVDKVGSESIKSLEKQGLVRSGSGRLPADFWELPRPEDKTRAALNALLSERETGL